MKVAQRTQRRARARLEPVGRWMFYAGIFGLGVCVTTFFQAGFLGVPQTAAGRLAWVLAVLALILVTAVFLRTHWTTPRDLHGILMGVAAWGVGFLLTLALLRFVPGTGWSWGLAVVGLAAASAALVLLGSILFVLALLLRASDTRIRSSDH
jgi:hypothetical protein